MKLTTSVFSVQYLVTRYLNWIRLWVSMEPGYFVWLQVFNGIFFKFFQNFINSYTTFDQIPADSSPQFFQIHSPTPCLLPTSCPFLISSQVQFVLPIPLMYVEPSTRAWLVARATPLRNTDLPSLRSHQLSVASQHVESSS